MRMLRRDVNLFRDILQLSTLSVLVSFLEQANERASEQISETSWQRFESERAAPRGCFSLSLSQSLSVVR